jgi:hypothetical protein
MAPVAATARSLLLFVAATCVCSASSSSAGSGGGTKQQVRTLPQDWHWESLVPTGVANRWGPHAICCYLQEEFVEEVAVTPLPSGHIQVGCMQLKERQQSPPGRHAHPRHEHHAAMCTMRTRAPLRRPSA